jgi:tRNA1Val (adenine37-N6)-methyltransferase
MSEQTTDSLFNGGIQIKQDRTGYRFSIDAVLLASLIRPRFGERLVDLGTGCGIIPLMLAFHHPHIKIYGVEVQKELADIAAGNVRDNQMAGQIEILCEDMKHVCLPMVSGPVDIVTSNPPYGKPRSGRINPNRQRAQARHEISVSLSDVIQTARRLLRRSGRFVMIYSAERTIDVMTLMRSGGIEPKFFRTVHSTSHSGAKRILVEGMKGGRLGLKIAPPLVINQPDGTYTEEVQRMLFPR